MKHTSCIYL